MSRTLCEAAHVAGARGEHGAVIAVVGGYRAGAWLEQRGAGTRARVMAAVARGLAGSCGAAGACSASALYRRPGTRGTAGGGALSEDTQLVVKRLMRKIKSDLI